MTQTCGYYLSHFAQSVDTVDDQTYQNVKGLLDDYFLNTLRASYYAALIDGVRVNSRPGLETEWTNRQFKDSIEIGDEQTGYSGMRAYAYHKSKELWVVAKDGGLLARPGAELEDVWSMAGDMPAYVEEGATSDAVTALMLPLRYGKRVFGVLVLEFAGPFEHTDSARAEIQLVAAALARIAWLHQTTSTQLADTRSAFNQLKELFAAHARPLTKPAIFVAFSGQADPAVLGCLREILGGYSNLIDTHYWNEISEPGNVNAKILDTIAKSEYGICYFSEPDGSSRFRDNPNVLFEAGILQALTNDRSTFPRGWIPIRESEELSGPPPFDFAQELMIIVQRSNGAANLDSFRHELNRMMDTLIST